MAIIVIHIYRHFQTVMVTEEKLLPSRPLGSQARFLFFIFFSSLWLQKVHAGNCLGLRWYNLASEHCIHYFCSWNCIIFGSNMLNGAAIVWGGNKLSGLLKFIIFFYRELVKKFICRLFWFCCWFFSSFFLPVYILTLLSLVYWLFFVLCFSFFISKIKHFLPCLLQKM